ncbi:MAG TPA: hypothetical protein VN457_02500 [Chlamydiales bacterium]|nr:hypothetical protein [Chlamydiales bacterium]
MKKQLFLALLVTSALSMFSLNAFPSKQAFSKYKNKYFVETGTFMGDGLQLALNLGYPILHSIEISPTHYQKAKKRFSKNKNVHLWLGDSSKILVDVLRQIDAPATFWLDGHYSGGDTSKGETMSPLLRELAAIKNHPIKTHTLLIDDARQFGTADFDGLTLEQIKATILSINPNYQFTFEDCGLKQDFLKNDVLVAYIKPAAS